MVRSVHHFIGGKIVPGTGGRTGDVYNPATGEVQAKVDFASAVDTQAAIRAAQAALPEWAATPPVRRARVMFRFKELLEKHMDELAGILTSEHGKVFSDAQGEILRGLEVVEFACGAPNLLLSGIRQEVFLFVEQRAQKRKRFHDLVLLVLAHIQVAHHGKQWQRAARIGAASGNCLGNGQPRRPDGPLQKRWAAVQVAG